MEAETAEKPSFSDESLFWSISAGLIACVVVGLLVWHLAARPDTSVVQRACTIGTVKGGTANGMPILGDCPVDNGPWPAHHWIWASLGAAIVILILGRSLLFMHRMESQGKQEGSPATRESETAGDPKSPVM